MRKNKSKSKSSKRKKINPTLAAMFKMSREELASRKMTGGGVHKTDPRHKSRGTQNRRAIEDQLD